MVIYLVGIGAFILGANVGLVIALVVLHGRAQSLAEEHVATTTAPQDVRHAEEPMTAAYI